MVMLKFRRANESNCYYSVEEFAKINNARKLSGDEQLEMSPNNLLRNDITNCHSGASVNPSLGYGYYKLSNGASAKMDFDTRTFFIHVRKMNGVDLYIKNVTGEELIDYNTTLSTENLYISCESLFNVIRKSSFVDSSISGLSKVFGKNSPKPNTTAENMITIFRNGACEYDEATGEAMIKFDYVCKWLRNAELNMRVDDNKMFVLSLRIRDKYIQPILGEILWLRDYR